MDEATAARVASRSAMPRSATVRLLVLGGLLIGYSLAAGTACLLAGLGIDRAVSDHRWRTALQVVSAFGIVLAAGCGGVWLLVTDRFAGDQSSRQEFAPDAR